MNSAVLLLLSGLGFISAYFIYGKYLRVKIYELDPRRPTPAHRFEDGVDFVPANRYVLFGHHFASIAGLGPILGPAIAVIWGWLPALLWVVFGSIFIGAVHDFSALALSLRHDGRSIGEITENLVGPRAKILFQLIIFFLLALAMGVFVLVITQVFAMYPQGIIPTLSLIVIAVFIGLAIYKYRLALGPVSLVGLILMFAMIFYGIGHPVTGVSSGAWMWILIAYAFTASVLPVWLLLQPRDYLNSFQLYIGLTLLILGIFFFRSPVTAPAINTTAGDLPPIMPFLFITIACGAISGFHNLVSTGTTARQLNTEKDAQLIGYGGMLVEGLLAVLVILATTAALGGAQEWQARYGSWQGMNGLKPQLDAFITGSGNILSHVGIPVKFGSTFIAVMVVSFALTTLDSATRLLRYNVEELGRTFRLPLLQNRYLAALIAVLAIAYFAFMKIDGRPAGLILWQLFGTTNQNLAAIGFIGMTIYLLKNGKNFYLTLLPLLFMFTVTMYAMLLKLTEFLTMEPRTWSLIVVSLIIILMTVWLAVEGSIVFGQEWKKSCHRRSLPGGLS
ncbi:MAG: carbon starvation protein A [Candidatus Neomarinimicrobiota bacterium]